MVKDKNDLLTYVQHLNDPIPMFFVILSTLLASGSGVLFYFLLGRTSVGVVVLYVNIIIQIFVFLFCVLQKDKLFARIVYRVWIWFFVLLFINTAAFVLTMHASPIAASFLLQGLSIIAGLGFGNLLCRSIKKKINKKEDISKGKRLAIVAGSIGAVAACIGRLSLPAILQHTNQPQFIISSCVIVLNIIFSMMLYFRLSQLYYYRKRQTGV